MKRFALALFLTCICTCQVQAGPDINVSILNNNSCDKIVRIYRKLTTTCGGNSPYDVQVQAFTVHPGQTQNYQEHLQPSPFCDNYIVWRVTMDPGIVVMPEGQSSSKVFRAVLGDGSGTCTNLVDHDDPGDGGTHKSSEPNCGMAQWSVSEPYVNLSFSDEPLGYQPSIGSRVSFNLDFKQREFGTGLDPTIFSVGKRWNFSWYSLVTQSASTKTAHLSDGREISFNGNPLDYLTNTKLTGATNTGFTLNFPDGSQDVYGYIVTNTAGVFLEAFRTEHWNPQSQKTYFYYDSYIPGASPVVRLKFVVDADGRTNSVYYVNSHPYSTNLIDHVVDPFGRTTYLSYDNSGHLTNITDVAGIASAFGYANDLVTNLTTPYGKTIFETTTATNARSVRITEPDGGHELYLYQDSTPGMPASYSSGQIPSTASFANTFDTSALDTRNSYYWGSRQYAALSTTNIASFTTNDFFKARTKHWLMSFLRSPGDTLSMQRDPSPDSGGNIEGQKTWFDYAGKTNNAYEGAQVLPLFVAQVLPDGSTSFTRTIRNGIGAVTNEVDTYSVSSGSTVLLRTNIFVYDSSGIDFLAFTNALGNLAYSNVFNAAHEVVTNFNALAEQTVYTYDGSNRLTSVTGPTGLTVTNLYGSDGFLAQQFAQGFFTNTYTYSNDLVATFMDARGVTVSNRWDNLQRLVRQDYSDGTFITNTYQFLDLVRVIDRMGFTNSFAYDSMRRLTNVADANFHQTIFNYCNCGSLDSIQDAAGNLTQFFRDNLGRANRTSYADGYSITNQFDLLGRLTNVTDSSGASVTNWFNNQGIEVAKNNGFGGLFSVACDVLDRVTNTVDFDGVAIISTYDNLNRLLTQSYPDGGIQIFGYSPGIVGVTRYTNQLFQGTLYGYDIAGRKTSVTNANGEVTQFGYSGPGDLLLFADGKNQQTRWSYDKFGRVTNKLDAANNVVFAYSYDADGRLTNRWTPVSGDTAYSFDAVGNLKAVTYLHSLAISFSYDAMNRLTNMADAVGVTSYNYNAAGQLLSEDGPWDNDIVGYSYQNRLRTGMSLAAPNASPWVHTYAYDSMRRLTNASSPAGAFTYWLGARGGASPLIKRLLLPNGAYITNSYDVNARLSGTYMRNSGDALLDANGYAYNTGNQRTQQVFTSGNFESYTYDNIGQLKTVLGREPGGVTNRMQEQFGYSYDAAGNVSYRTNNTLVGSFSLNNLNELTAVSSIGNLTVAGSTTGQATNVTVNASSATLYADNTFASTNQSWIASTNVFTAIAMDSRGRVDTNSVAALLAFNSVFDYDLNGNILRERFAFGKTNRVFAYDDENELTAVWVTNSWKSEFAYDGKMRRRIRREYTWTGASWLQTNEVRYIYDGNAVVQERNQNNLPQVTYTRGYGLLARTDNTLAINPALAPYATGIYHVDANGNVTCLIYTNQTIAARYSYDPFGNIISQSGSLADKNLYRFSGKEFHVASGLVHYAFRDYAPDIQRWINRDPTAESGGANLYAFCGNNPINSFDPLGLSCESWYDDLAQWAKDHDNRFKDVVNNNVPPWLATILDSNADSVSGLLNMPSLLGHAGEATGETGYIGDEPLFKPISDLGTGTGTFYANPTLENSAGLFQDVSTFFSTAAPVVGTTSFGNATLPGISVTQGGAGQTIALDANAFKNLDALRNSGLIGPSDKIIVTPNVQVELARHGVSASDLSSAGVTIISDSPIGASVPASSLAQTLRGLGGRGAASASADALNISEAAGAGAGVFITKDAQILRAFGGGVTLPKSGGVFINVSGF